MDAEPNYRRTKPGIRSHNPNTNGAAGPASQIPGLSSTANDTPEEKTKGGRRVGLQASDSDYVRLAKQGGQKGLLWHEDPVENPDSSYTPSNFLCDTLDGQDSRIKAATPDGERKHQSKGAAKPLEAPFGTDNCSAWDRETDKEINNATSGMEKVSLSPKDIEETNRFKKTSHDKKTAAPVSMSKLLSFGYVEEEKKSPNDDDTSSMASEQTSTIAPEDELE